MSQISDKRNIHFFDTICLGNGMCVHAQHIILPSYFWVHLLPTEE